MTTARLRSAAVFIVGVITASMFLALAGGASATTYCVHDPACSATGTTEPSVQAGLSAAASHPLFDTVKVGPGSYSRQGGYFYPSGSGSVALIGAGSGQTKLTNPGDPTNSDDVIQMAGAKTTVQNLRVIIPNDSTFTLFGDRGLVLSGGASAEGVAVTAPSTVVLDVGVDLGGTSSFTGGSVTLPQSSVAPNTAIVDRDVGVVSDSTLQGATAIAADGSATVNRTRLLPGAGDGIVDFTGTASVHNSLIDLGSFPAVGIRAASSSAAQTPVVHADHVTIVGGGSGSVGVEARATAAIDNGSQSVTATLSNSVISGPETSIDREAQNTSTTNPGTNTANVTTSYSSYGKFKQTNMNGPNGAGAITADHFVTGTPAFVGPDDFRPAAGSNLVDSGDPRFSGGIDLLGNPRVFDGDGDGVAITDLGAYERQ